jgi:ubiquinone/menaquinone biosynthesis C-methylase UbiE/broad specificity phosphatase PhoE
MIQLPDPLPKQPTRLLLVCHAESVQRRFGNVSLNDTGLTALGWEQASSLADWLRLHESLDSLVCAQQLRSRLTAQRIAQAFELPTHVAPGFPPAPKRLWTGMPPAPEDEEWPDYEAYAQAVLQACDQLLQQRWGENTALILNASAIAALIREISSGHGLGIEIEHTSISEIVMNEGRWYLAYANRREHLPRSVLPSAPPPPDPQADQVIQTQISAIRKTYNRLATNLTTGEPHHLGMEGMSPGDFLDFASFEPGQRILEIGTGTGEMAMALAKAGAREVIGTDLSPAMLEYAEYLRAVAGDEESLSRVSFRLASAHALPFAAETFDLVLVNLVLHHLSQIDRTIQELIRVLRPDGLLILAEFAGNEDPVKRATQNAIEYKRNPSHAIIRTAEQLRQKLEDLGLSVEREKIVTRERLTQQWLDEMQVDKSVRQAVLEMLEASIETDAAGLNIRRKDNDLIFDQHFVYLQARKG